MNYASSSTHKEMLDSDDEFPVDYFDVPSTPACEIDNRFDKIHFKWIDGTPNYKKNDIGSRSNPSHSPQQDKDNDKQNPISSNDYNNRKVIKKGYLSKHDLFCLNSIKGYVSDSTFMWFIEFLMYKDLQSKYNFCKGCLVSTNVNYKNYNVSDVKLSKNKSKYKLIVKG